MTTTMNVTTVYNSDTRVLQSVATLTGAVEAVPGQVLSATDIKSITLFSQPNVTAYDQQQVALSAGRAIIAVNVQLQQWNAAAANTDKADAILGSESDLDAVGIFDDVIESGATPDAAGIFDATIVNPPPSNPA